MNASLLTQCSGNESLTATPNAIIQDGGMGGSTRRFRVGRFPRWIPQNILHRRFQWGVGTAAWQRAALEDPHGDPSRGSPGRTGSGESPHRITASTSGSVTAPMWNSPQYSPRNPQVNLPEHPPEVNPGGEWGGQHGNDGVWTSGPGRVLEMCGIARAGEDDSSRVLGRELLCSSSCCLCL
jgi:hypothetical protein